MLLTFESYYHKAIHPHCIFKLMKQQICQHNMNCKEYSLQYILVSLTDTHSSLQQQYHWNHAKASVAYSKCSCIS